MTPDTPRFARIHVRPSPGTEVWPVVERVNGGWQSGGHHYPDATVLGVAPLHLIPNAELVEPNDHPELDQVRAALAALQIPVDEDGIQLPQLPPERQVTCLLAVLGAWVQVFQQVHEADRDPLDQATMQMIMNSAVFEATGGGHAPAGMNVAGWHLQWAGMIVLELGRNVMADSTAPAAAIVHLMRGAAALLQSWQEAQRSAASFTVGDSVYAITDGDNVHTALAEAEKALAHIRAIIGETE